MSNIVIDSRSLWFPCEVCGEHSPSGELLIDEFGKRICGFCEFWEDIQTIAVKTQEGIEIDEYSIIEIALQDNVSSQEWDALLKCFGFVIRSTDNGWVYFKVASA